MPSMNARAGDRAFIVQITGDGNTVIPGVAHLELLRPDWLSYGLDKDKITDDASLLLPKMEVTPLLGRDAMLEDFMGWAEGEGGAPVRVVQGSAGMGKTRFGLELCQRLITKGWKAGFVTMDEAKRFGERENLSAWGWNTPTFVVFDYAMSSADMLKKWIEELSNNPCLWKHPLRVLLLERHADMGQGWCSRVFSTLSLRKMLDRPEPIALDKIGSLEFKRQIMDSVLVRLGSAEMLQRLGNDFDAQLARAEWSSVPLFLMMAAMTMHQRGGEAALVLSLGRTDLAREVAETEHRRIVQPCGRDAGLENFLSHMAAFVTLCGGLEGNELSEAICQEKTGLDSPLDRDRVETILGNGLHGPANGAGPILPDIVGEAFTLRRLGRESKQEAELAVERAFGLHADKVAACLVRCVQDFAPRAGARQAGKDTQAPQEQTQAIGWLQHLAASEDLPLERLMTFADELPASSLALRKFSTELSAHLSDRIRTEMKDGVNKKSLLAKSLNNLAGRLSELGKKQEALARSVCLIAVYLYNFYIV